MLDCIKWLLFGFVFLSPFFQDLKELDAMTSKLTDEETPKIQQNKDEEENKTSNGQQSKKETNETRSEQENIEDRTKMEETEAAKALLFATKERQENSW